jgi:signal transduction histidine kinase
MTATFGFLERTDLADACEAAAWHGADLYQDDQDLADDAVVFLAPALRDPDAAALLIATAAHRRLIEDRLVASVRGDGAMTRLVSLDAAGVLASLLVKGGVPDPSRFRDLAEGWLEQANPRGGPVRIFTDLSGLLWRAGHHTTALAIEGRWQDVLRAHPVRLLCGYAKPDVASIGGVPAFHALCEAHTVVIPRSSHAELGDPEGRWQAANRLGGQLEDHFDEPGALAAYRGEVEAVIAELRRRDEVRNELTAMLVHDIRGTANVIVLLLHLLKAQEGRFTAAEAQGFLHRALENTEQIERLTDDLLRLARIDELGFTYDLHPIDLHALVERVADKFAMATDHDVTVTVEQPLPLALVDDHRQVQILDNLLSNATKYAPPASPVRVTLSWMAPWIGVRVHDEGPGVPPEELPLVFRPFFRSATREEGPPGSGLGLHIARTLVEGQGGEIAAESGSASGFTVVYTVPAVPEGHHGGTGS